MTARAALGRILRRDRVLHAMLALGLALLAVCRLSARLAPDWAQVVCDLSDLAMLGVVVLVLRRAAPAEPLERRFWQLLSLAMGSYLLVTALNLANDVWPAAARGLEILRNLGYTSIYLWVILALELKPHQPLTANRELAFRWLEGTGAALAVLGLFGYLAGLPWLTDARIYATNVPETVLYLCLDGFLLLRLRAQLTHVPSSWKATHVCLLLTVGLWIASDGLEVARWAGLLPAPVLGAALDALWLPAFLAPALAARVRGLTRRDPAAARIESGAPATPSRGSLLVGLVLMLPLVHAAFVGLEVWEPGRGRAYALWVIAVSLCQAALAARYFHGIEELAAERALGLAEANHVLERHLASVRAARDDADAANQAKTRFLAAMSHEIRTPMNGVLGNVSLLRRTKLDEAQQQLTASLERSGHALLAIVDEILDLSRLEAGRLKLASEPFAVADTIEEAVESLAELARAKGLDFGCVIEGLREPLHGDRHRLLQIMVNLIGNAVKFTERGEVAVFARALVRDAGAVTLRVEVADTGVGIPPEAAGLIFEPFGQTSVGRRAGGSGLGLAISRQLALLMGGEIDFESRAGSGSVFRLTLRLERAPAGAAAPVVPPPAGRVLIVEPGALSRFALERHCAELDIEAVSVTDASAARRQLRAAAARRDAYDLALVAAELLGSGEDGLLHWLQEDPVLARTRVVCLGDLTAGQQQEHATLMTMRRPVLRRSFVQALVSSSRSGGGPLSVDNATRGLAPRQGLALVAEDNPVNQAVVEGMLGVLGWEVELAQDGSAALERLERTRYDVVLMDCMMPSKSGFEVAAELRRHERVLGVSRTPIVAVTAGAMAGDRERCLAAGMDEYLPKPFSIEKLEAVLARVLGRRESAPLTLAEAGSL